MTTSKVDPLSHPADKDGNALLPGDVVTVGRVENPTERDLCVVTPTYPDYCPLGFAVEIRRVDGGGFGADYGTTRFLAGVCLAKVSDPTTIQQQRAWRR